MNKLLKYIPEENQHSPYIYECCEENLELVNSILSLLKGKSQIFSKEILLLCIDEINYISLVN